MRIVTLSYTACACLGVSLAASAMWLLEFNVEANSGALAAVGLVTCGVVADHISRMARP